MKKEFITNLQGKEFVLFEGLLNEFHENGGNSIETFEVADSTQDHPKFKAVVKGEKGVFTGHGDANSENVNRLIGKHMYRMAETRAIARALRWYNNIGMCSADELGGDDKATKQGKSDPAPSQAPKEKPRMTDNEKNMVLGMIASKLPVEKIRQQVGKYEVSDEMMDEIKKAVDARQKALEEAKKDLK